MKTSQQSVFPPHATWRAILLGVLLAVPHSYFSVQTPTPSTVSLIYPAIFSLALFVFINLALKRWLARYAFSQGELLTIYSMVSIAVAVAGHDVLHVVAPILGHAFWFATPENEWQTLFFQYIPRWLTVDDMGVLKGLYEGDESLFDWHTIRAWLTPVAWWSLLLMSLILVMLGLNTLIRKQWMEHERLAYPIIQLPLAMSENAGSAQFFRNPMLWIGIAIGGGVDLINGLHAFVPAIPLLPIRTVEIGALFTERPLSAIGWTPVCFFPFVIGLSYLMPLDLAFSCWFFYLVWKLEFVLGASLGLRGLPEFPYVKPQSSGAYLAIAVLALWSTRRHLGRLLAGVFRRNGNEDAGEPMRYRTALACIFGGSGFLLYFCLKAGMSLWVFVLFFSFYFLLVFALTRMRAELGPPVNELYNIGPDQMLPRVFGARRLGATNLTMFAMFWGFNRAHRCNPMPYQLEAFKLAGESKTHPRHLVAAMLLAAAVGIWVAFWGFLQTHYDQGFGGGFGWEAYRNLERWIYYMPPKDGIASGFMGGGFGLVLLMTVLRRQLLWWTLHPVAYPLASSWTMNWMWFPILISWCVKRMLLRHGGIAAYRKAIPFFLGLVLGEYLVGGIWNVYGTLAHRYVYSFWH